MVLRTRMTKNEIPFLDLSIPRQPRPKHRSRTVKALLELRPDEKIIHDHRGYRTSMSNWIARQRIRLQRDFRYTTQIGASHLYLVWVVEAQSTPGLIGSEAGCGTYDPATDKHE
jgi:hypothetical protein